MHDVKADAHPENIRMNHGSYEFDIKMKDWCLPNTILNMGGMHNIENITAAITVAHKLGIEAEKIKKAVADFKGVRRSFEYVLKKEGPGLY